MCQLLLQRLFSNQADRHTAFRLVLNLSPSLFPSAFAPVHIASTPATPAAQLFAFLCCSSFTHCFLTSPSPASPFLLHLHNRKAWLSRMSLNSDQGSITGQPGSASYHDQSEPEANTRLREADDCPDRFRQGQEIPPEPVQGFNNKLELPQARRTCGGGRYLDVSVQDPRGIFCLESVPCCSGPFTNTGECLSSTLGGFCVCKLPMHTVFQGPK